MAVMVEKDEGRDIVSADPGGPSRVSMQSALQTVWVSSRPSLDSSNPNFVSRR